MKKIFLSTLMFGNLFLNANQNYNYIDELEKPIKENVKAKDIVMYQKINGDDFQLSNFFNAEINIKNFEDEYLKHLEIKAGLNNLFRIKDYHITNNLENQTNDLEKFQGYGSLKIKLLNDNIKNTFGIVNLNTPLLNSKNTTTIYKTYYYGDLFSSKFSISETDTYLYFGYFNKIDKNFSGLEDINNINNKGIYTIGGFLTKNNIDTNLQLIYNENNYIEYYFDVTNIVNNKLKSSFQFLYQENKNELIKLYDNYIYGAKTDYLIDSENLLSFAINIKKDLSNNNIKNIDFNDYNINLYTNSLYLTPINFNNTGNIKISYKTNYKNNKYSINFFKTFEKFDDNLFEDSVFELDLRAKMILDNPNTNYSFDFIYLNRKEDNTDNLIKNKIFRIFIEHKF